jgi:dGTP triphosphohydrolase
VGETGDDGEVGEDGEIGMVGDVGLRGMTGAQGEEGEVGEKGAPGEQGPTGKALSLYDMDPEILNAVVDPVAQEEVARAADNVTEDDAEQALKEVEDGLEKRVNTLESLMATLLESDGAPDRKLSANARSLEAERKRRLR